MSGFGPALYGDPCRECGFTWSIGREDAVSLVAGLPASYGALLEGASGSERTPLLAWSATAYVCHVADNLRIWAERLMGVVRGAAPEVAAYDTDLLAKARRYEEVSLEGARWSLERAVTDWLDAVANSHRTGPVLVHPERGPQTLEEVAVSNAHDAAHHRHDLERILSPAS